MSDFDAPWFNYDAAARTHLENIRWPNGPVCPHCGVVDRAGQLQGKSTRPGVWKCYECRKPFSVTVGTVFERSKIALHLWFRAVYMLCSSKKGFSSHQMHRMLGVTYKTAWFMTHRIREAFRDGGAGPLGGANKVVEIDETYVGGKAKNRKNHVPSKQALVSLVERNGRVRSFHVANVNANTLRPVIKEHVARSTYVMTDDSTVYPPIMEGRAHGTVNHSAEEYVRAYFWHTNTIENFFSIFKRGIMGVYHHVSPAHLHRYATEFDFRFNERAALGMSDMERTIKALKGIGGKRLTYQQSRPVRIS